MNISTVLKRTRFSLVKIKKTHYSTQNEQIVLPKPIPRGPTDLLRALEATIDKDPTAAHYKYHDDPFLIPQSNVGKRTFAMAQEAGRKAAHWIRKEHGDLFQHKEADPPIEKFFPPLVYDEKSDVSEADLIKVIDQVLVTDAVTIYKVLKEKNVEVSADSLQSLLELLCFYNGENALGEEFVEERWFRQSTKGKEKQRKTWNDGAFAEEIFISLPNTNSSSYSALIQGMVKHYQVDRAYQLFEEAQQKNIIVNTDAYNAIISVANFLKESYDMRWGFVVNLLSQMRDAKLKPNLGTLNAVLHCLSTMGGGRIAKENALKTLVEFKNLGIQPSLASWYYILITYCKERGPISSILVDILNEIENKEYTIRDPRDVNFFVTAMDICRYHLNDLELARRVHRLVQFGNNYDLIGDSYKESIYYRHYFILECTFQPIDEFMQNTYYKLVPHIYVPEPGVMEEVLAAIEAAGAIQYMPKLWSDIIVFDHIFRENLLNKALDIMVNSDADTELKEKFANIAWEVYNKIEGQHEYKTNKLVFTGDLLGKIMTLLCKNKSFENASTILNLLDKGHHAIAGVPKLEPLSLYVDLCIEEKTPSKAIACIQYCADLGYPEAEDLGRKLINKLSLDENHLQKLSKIVGEYRVQKENTS